MEKDKLIQANLIQEKIESLEKCIENVSLARRKGRCVDISNENEKFTISVSQVIMLKVLDFVELENARELSSLRQSFKNL